MTSQPITINYVVLRKTDLATSPKDRNNSIQIHELERLSPKTEKIGNLRLDIINALSNLNERGGPEIILIKVRGYTTH